MKRFKTLITLTMAAGVLLLTYQNCGPEAPTSDDNSSAGGAPFAYSITIDRFAYTSCNSNTTSADYFSFKMGAYDTLKTGVQLSADFQQATAGYAPNRKVEALNAAEINRDAQLAFGLRPQEDATAAITVNGQTAVKNVLSPLNTAPAVTDLVNLSAGQFLPDAKYPLKAAFQFGIANDQALRDSLNSQANGFTVGPLMPGSRYGQRVIGNMMAGMSFFPTFDCGPTPAGMHVLCALQEYPGVGAPPAGNWDCPSQFQFKIVRAAGDANAAGCNFSSPQTSDPVYVEVRKILGPNWQIDVNGGCLLPNNGSCYPAGTGTVDYNVGATCDQAGQPACARHFSVCLKDN